MKNSSLAIIFLLTAAGTAFSKYQSVQKNGRRSRGKPDEERGREDSCARIPIAEEHEKKNSASSYWLICSKDLRQHKSQNYSNLPECYRE